MKVLWYHFHTQLIDILKGETICFVQKHVPLELHGMSHDTCMLCYWNEIEPCVAVPLGLGSLILRLIFVGDRAWVQGYSSVTHFRTTGTLGRTNCFFFVISQIYRYRNIQQSTEMHKINNTTTSMQLHTHISIHYIFSSLQMFNIVYQEAFESFLIGGVAAQTHASEGLNHFHLVHPLTVAHFQPHRFTWHDNFFWVSNSYMVHMTFTNAAVYSRIWNDTGPIWINMVSSSHVGTPTKFRTYSVDRQLSKTFCTCECYLRQGTDPKLCPWTCG